MKKFNPASLQLIATFGIGLINLICYWFLLAAGALPQQMSLFFKLQAILGIAYFLILYLIEKLPPQASAHNAIFFKKMEMWILSAILAFALAYRIILLFDYPYLTDDIFRYIWDGRVWSHGINPFRFAPADPALIPIRDAIIYPQVNHPHIPTIYAPVLQLIFRMVASISPSIFAFKLSVVVFDCGTIFLLLLLLKHWQFALRRVIIYAWNPLVIIEIAGSSHLDGIGVFFLLLGFYLFEKRHTIFSGIAFAAAIMVKFVPILLLPFIVRKKNRNWTIIFLGSVTVTILLGYTPFLNAGEALFKAMFIYADKWRFNDSIFYLIFNALDLALPDAVVKIYVHSKGMMPDAETMRTMRTDLILIASKGLTGVMFCYVLACLFRCKAWKFSGQFTPDLLRIWIIIFGTLCILSPTLHPWYLIWILPLMVFEREKSWLVLSVSILWSYEIISRYAESGVWQESGWIKLAVFVPFYGVLIFEITRQWAYFSGLLRAGLPDRWRLDRKNAGK